METGVVLGLRLEGREYIRFGWRESLWAGDLCRDLNEPGSNTCGCAGLEVGMAFAIQPHVLVAMSLLEAVVRDEVRETPPGDGLGPWRPPWGRWVLFWVWSEVWRVLCRRWTGPAFHTGASLLLSGGWAPLEEAEAGLWAPHVVQAGHLLAWPWGPDAEEWSLLGGEGLGQFQGFALLPFLLGFLRYGTVDKT